MSTVCSELCSPSPSNLFSFMPSRWLSLGSSLNNKLCNPDFNWMRWSIRWFPGWLTGRHWSLGCSTTCCYIHTQLNVPWWSQFCQCLRGQQGPLQTSGGGPSSGWGSSGQWGGWSPTSRVPKVFIAIDKLSIDCPHQHLILPVVAAVCVCMWMCVWCVRVWCVYVVHVCVYVVHVCVWCVCVWCMCVCVMCAACGECMWCMCVVCVQL